MKVQVRKGDTLWYYSHLFMIPLALLIESNPTINPRKVEISQEIKIPGFQIITYQIKKEDTLSEIALKRNISLDALYLLNRNINLNELPIGQSIFLPKRVSTPLVQGKRAYSYEDLLKDINDLKKVYPFIQIRTIGKSVMGKPLHEIRVGNGNKKVHMNASFHANEWITTPILMRFLNTYLLSLINGNKIEKIAALPLFHEVELSIVPMVNPDGVNLVLHGPPDEVREQVQRINGDNQDFTGWKANIRGIDLNNQYPANWEIEKERKVPKSQAPRDYPGEAPLTEPEAIAMANLAMERDFDRVLALHTQGEEFYWGYEGFEPEHSESIAKEFAKVSGYRSVQYVDSHAGFKDWFIRGFGKAGFTLELGKGINPLPLSQFDKIYSDIQKLLLAALYM